MHDDLKNPQLSILMLVTLDAVMTDCLMSLLAILIDAYKYVGRTTIHFDDEFEK